MRFEEARQRLRRLGPVGDGPSKSISLRAASRSGGVAIPTVAKKVRQWGRALETNWLNARPHLRGLANKMQAVLEIADSLYAEGQEGGDAVDYGAFELKVSQATGELECAERSAQAAGGSPVQAAKSCSFAHSN